MSLFPQSFIDEVRQHADIVTVVQDHVALRQAGTSYKGLCPFHDERTPSFHVHRDRGFFHCFGCGLGGDVFKFLQLHEKVGFQEAVVQLAVRFGVPVPDVKGDRDPALDAERETLLQIHELAAAFFQDELRSPHARKARAYLEGRDLPAELWERMGLGYAPNARERVRDHLTARGLDRRDLIRAGIVIERDGRNFDRFRDRLMVPICRENGVVVAFGGRALGEGQGPKYLNSPETPVYSKGRTLYGLHLSKAAIRTKGFAVLVEGYFDLAQALLAGVEAVVATCGTALTRPQAVMLRRFASRAVLSFDPDAAGEGAAVRSCDLLIAEGFQVNVAELPAGTDPDTLVRRDGAEAYRNRLKGSRPYLDFLLDRSAVRHDMNVPEQRRRFLESMLGVAARIPEATARDLFADRLAHRAQITEDVVRAEIRRAAVTRQTSLADRPGGGGGRLKPAERDLLSGLVRDAERAMAALSGLESDDFRGLEAGRILSAALDLGDLPPSAVPTALFERLSTEDVELLSGSAARATAPATPEDCVRALRKLRFERERAEVQGEIARLQDQGAGQNSPQIAELWQRKKLLLDQIEALNV